MVGIILLLQKKTSFIPQVRPASSPRPRLCPSFSPTHPRNAMGIPYQTPGWQERRAGGAKKRRPGRRRERTHVRARRHPFSPFSLSPPPALHSPSPSSPTPTTNGRHQEQAQSGQGEGGPREKGLQSRVRLLFYFYFSFPRALHPLPAGAAAFYPREPGGEAGCITPESGRVQWCRYSLPF